MSVVEPLVRHRDLGLAGPVLDLWLALAAGRLLLRRPDDEGLRRLVGARLPMDDPQHLSQAIADGADTLLLALTGEAQHEPLARISVGCRLSAFDLDLLGLAVLPCLDEDAAATVAQITGGRRRLSLGLVLKLLIGDAGRQVLVRQALRLSPLWRAGLLHPVPPDASLLERILEPSEGLLAGLDGEAPEWIGAGWVLRSIPEPLNSTGSLRALVGRLVALGTTAPVHLAGRPERAEQVLALSAAGAPCLVFDAPADDPEQAPWAEAHLVGLATGTRVALRCDGARLDAPPPGIAPPPVIARQSFALRGPGAALLRLDVGGSDPMELSDAWGVALGMSEADADVLAGRNWLDAQAPFQLAADLPEGLDTEAALARIAVLTPPHALRLAVRRMADVPWERLVVPGETETRLEDVVRRVRRRVTVQCRWGMASGGRGRSVVALLHGESGTGKTLAAEAVATRLALPMLSVDLSLVVSKYIGETEKNLAELFAAAEGYSALLFFDEADALFGRRTNVQDAHDRYANIEVNFLLQRLEAFEGLALLSTNLLQGVDEAFLRRFDQVVQFPRPSVAERLVIWREHLPRGHLAPDIDASALAERFDLTGGEIRNAALGAAFAAADGDGVVTSAMLDVAVADEYIKKGRPFPRR